MPLTIPQLEARLNFIEAEIANTRDPKNLPYLNATYQKLMDRLVELDLAEQDTKCQ